MKPLLSLLLGLLLTSTALPARAGGFDWGLTAGLNVSKLKYSGSHEFQSDNRTGWFLGPTARVSLFAGLGLDGSLLYSQQRLNLALSGQSSPYQDTKTARCFSVPVNARYTLGMGMLGVYISTGPQFDFNLGNKNWYAFDSQGRGGRIFAQENMTTTWNVGAGLRIMGRVELGLAYNFTLNRSAKSAPEDYWTEAAWTDQSKLRQNTFKVNLSVLF